MNTIKKIFKGDVDEVIHDKFNRFGRGDFTRFIISIKKAKDLKIKSSWDWSNDIFKMIADNIEGDVELSGKLIGNWDFESELPLEPSKFSKRGKVYTAEISASASPDVLKKIYEMFEMHFILLNVKSSHYKMRCGKSLPKPGKDLKEDFCKVTLPLDFLDEFVWKIKEFKEVSIRHIFHINDIIIPDEYKDDPKQARIHGKRKGIVDRVMDVDGKEHIEKKEFVI